MMESMGVVFSYYAIVCNAYTCNPHQMNAVGNYSASYLGHFALTYFILSSDFIMIPHSMLDYF